MLWRVKYGTKLLLGVQKMFGLHITLESTRFYYNNVEICINKLIFLNFN